MGSIPSSANMPSAKFTNPKNGDTIAANTAFNISMAINNLQTGAFVNAEENYFAAPQQLNVQGLIIGHSHVVIETLQALDQTSPTDPTKFAFFKVYFQPKKLQISVNNKTRGWMMPLKEVFSLLM